MKKIISLIICFVICLSFAACGKNNYIGIDKAKQTVVDDIGAALSDVEFAVNDLVTDNNGDYYKIHFTKDGTEYIYKVDAMTGEIIDKSSNFNDTDDNSDVTTTNNDTNNTNNTNNSNNVSDNNGNGNANNNTNNGNNNSNNNGNNNASNSSSSTNNAILD